MDEAVPVDKSIPVSPKKKKVKTKKKKKTQKAVDNDPSDLEEQNMTDDESSTSGEITIVENSQEEGLIIAQPETSNTKKRKAGKSILV